MATWLKRFSIFTAATTLVLIFAGGLVTSTGSALAVPDWPLSYGQLMPPMVGGIFYEHGHRMIASFVGVLTVILALWTQWGETRRWVRRLTWVALAMVVTQGVLGGLTVLYLLPDPISISHACLGQSFFCVLSLLAYARADWFARLAPSARPSRIPRFFLTLFLALFLQLLLGATMRHTEAGLAIPDFPRAFGAWIPPAWSPKIAVHFAHRAWGLCVFSLVCYGLRRVRRDHAGERWMNAFMLGIFALTCLQVVLGASVIWTARAVTITTLHVATGALILSSAFVLFVASAIRFGFDASAAADYWILGKPRITFLVTVSCFIGFFMAASTPLPWGLAGWTCFATALVAFGASTLNQFLEPDVDARMKRTAPRPIPAGRVSRAGALAFGIGVTALGLGVFLWKVNAAASSVALLTSVSYLLLYTPLKRYSSLCTIVGAIPGALPPVIGWVAVTGGYANEALILFAILFLWQLPHFLAIAWLYHDDYREAGLPMLTVIDRAGDAVGTQLFLYASALIPVALLPSMIGMTGRAYFFGSFFLGAAFLALSVALARGKSDRHARRLLLGSVLYLPLLYLLMALDKLA